MLERFVLKYPWRAQAFAPYVLMPTGILKSTTSHCLILLWQGELLERVHSTGVVDVEAHLPDGTLIAAAVPPGLHARLTPFALHPTDFERLLAATAQHNSYSSLGPASAGSRNL